MICFDKGNCLINLFYYRRCFIPWNKKNIVIIPAGGTGKRFESNIPKQFIDLGGVPILIRTLLIFENIPEIDLIIISMSKEWIGLTMELISQYKLKKIGNIVEGGFERQDSVYNALETKEAIHSEIILIHDAVRPFADSGLVRRIISAAYEFGAAVPALHPKETIKQIGVNNLVKMTIDRSKLICIQTPQGFRTDIIINSYQKANKEQYYSTDDAALVEAAGYPVKFIQGDEANIKITTKFDMLYAGVLLDILKDKSELNNINI